ncbi:MAG: flagellar motor protein [Acidobacteriota bacterium]
MDLGTLVGILIALAGIGLGLTLEGGSISQILQPTAALIVFGGTLGATLIAFPLPVFLSASKGLIGVFIRSKTDPGEVIAQIVAFAQKARRKGIISLESDADQVQDPFLKQALQMAVDGTDPADLRETMELKLACDEERQDRLPQVWEAAGGFAPTIGIIGAVLGLIQVMQHLDDIEEVGKGIAVAFVATIYGVGSANVFFLPAAAKMKLINRSGTILRQLMLEGVISILEGMNPRLIETKLRAFLDEQSQDRTEPSSEEESEAA